MGTYKIFKNSNSWWDFPYEVRNQKDYIVGIASTFWGAKRVIKKDIRKKNPVLIYEEECTD